MLLLSASTYAFGKKLKNNMSKIIRRILISRKTEKKKQIRASEIESEMIKSKKNQKYLEVTCGLIVKK